MRRVPVEDYPRILEDVLLQGKTNQEVGTIYGVTRERIRQIVFRQIQAMRSGAAPVPPDLVPVLEHAKTHKHIRPPKHGYCVACGQRKERTLREGRRGFRVLGTENDYCPRCLRKLYTEPVTLLCARCQTVATLTLARVNRYLRNASYRSGHTYAKFDPTTMSGTYLCKPCYYASIRGEGRIRRANDTVKIRLFCRGGCGKQKEVYLASARQLRTFAFDAEKQEGSYLCLACIYATGGPIQFHTTRSKQEKGPVTSP
jgi:hypothetical protein